MFIYLSIHNVLLAEAPDPAAYSDYSRHGSLERTEGWREKNGSADPIRSDSEIEVDQGLPEFW